VAAPFTSRTPNIAAVLDVLRCVTPHSVHRHRLWLRLACRGSCHRDGRAALATSFACFKYMSFYAMIQTTTVTILYGIDANLADFQVSLSLCLSLSLSVRMERTWLTWACAGQYLYIDLVLILPLAAASACLASRMRMLART
jgi:hypothetical protein